MHDENALMQMPGHLIRRLNQHAGAVFQERMNQARYDITSVQFAALETLSKHPGLDQAGLAKRIAYDRATIGGVVKRLVHKGLVTREPDPKDRRSFMLSLSTMGKEHLAKLRPLVATLQGDILEKLTDDEQTIFLGLLVKALSLDAESKG